MTVGGRWRIDKKKYKEIKSKDGKCVAVTHKSDNEKWKATFKFTPSDSKPEPKFKVIVVKDKETFWSGIEL
jgi:hypothetical protein